jgi:hypothetical protein
MLPRADDPHVKATSSTSAAASAKGRRAGMICVAFCLACALPPSELSFSSQTRTRGRFAGRQRDYMHESYELITEGG